MTNSEKHIVLVLDEKLSFEEHLDVKFKKANKKICVVKKLSDHLPRTALLTIYKSFVRPYLDYGDVIYDNPGNSSFTEKIESIQYNAALEITGAIRGTSKEKLYLELGLGYLRDHRRLKRLCLFF